MAYIQYSYTFSIKMTIFFIIHWIIKRGGLGLQLHVAQKLLCFWTKPNLESGVFTGRFKGGQSPLTNFLGKNGEFFQNKYGEFNQNIYALLGNFFKLLVHFLKQNLTELLSPSIHDQLLSPSLSSYLASSPSPVELLQRVDIVPVNRSRQITSSPGSYPASPK